MKKLYPLIALMCLFILQACPKAPETEDPVLTPIQTTYTIGADASEFTISFKTNLSYSVKSDASWLTVSTATKAVTTEKITAKASANTSTESRTANVTITGGTESATITVIQEGLTPSIVINGSTSYPIAADGGSFTVDVTSNVDYAVDINVDWITRDGNTFTVDPNDSESDRNGVITFSYGDISKVVAVKQNGKQKEEEPYITIGTTTYSVPAKGGSVNVAVTSNVDYSTSVNADWVSGSGTSFTVSENTATEARTATVTYSYGDISKTVTINQAAASDTPEEDVLENGGSATFTVPAAGDNIEVIVRSNVEYSVNISADWITQTKTKSVSEDKLNFAVAANEGAARSAEISFSYGDLTFSVSVSQKAYVAPTEDPYLEIDKHEVSAEAAGGTATINVNANYDYTAECDDDWVTVAIDGAVCTLTFAENKSTEIRTSMVQFSSEGLMEFLTITQAGAEIDEDPFDVGSNLSVNGTANCYVVTKAGTYTFDASVMGNGEEGVIWDEIQLVDQHLWPQVASRVSFKDSYYDSNTKPQKAYVIWDDNNVIEKVSFTKSTMVVTITTTGNEGNALIGVYDKWATGNTDPCLWSWHIWCTDSPKQYKQYDLSEQEYILLDRNLGAVSADPADSDKTYGANSINMTFGYYYQFGRKDPLRGYQGIAADLQEAPLELQDAINNPTAFYRLNTKTCEWFNNSTSSLATVTADLWGNPQWKHCSTANDHPFPATIGELQKTIYDPCPPGYMVPPETTWEGVAVDDITELENGVIIPTATGDSFYPYAGYISDLNSWEGINLGYYSFAGSEEMQGRDYRAATVYTSHTGKCSRWETGTHAPVYYGATYMAAFIYYKGNELEFDSAQSHVRQNARPVRCMRIPVVQ